MLTIAYIGATVLFLGILAAAFTPRLFKQAKVVAFTAQKTLESAIDNPIQENRYDIAKAEQQLQDYKQNLSKLIGANKGLEHDRDNADHDRVKYANLATIAAQRGNKNDVTEAISKKNSNNAKYENLSAEIKVNNDLISAVRDNIRIQEDKIEAAKAKATQLETRLTNVSIRSTMVNSELNGEGFASLDSLEQRVQEQENLLEGKVQVFSNTTLEQKYGQPDTNEEVEALLAQYQQH